MGFLERLNPHQSLKWINPQPRAVGSSPPSGQPWSTRDVFPTHWNIRWDLRIAPVSLPWSRCARHDVQGFKLPPVMSTFSRMRSKGSRFTLGVWGLRVCSLDVAFVVATVRNRSQPSATVRTNSVWPCLWEVLQRWSFLEVSDVWLLRFAWQAWHFEAFRRVLQRVESRFAWQAQYFCDVFRRYVAVFVPGAALWTCPSSFFVAGTAL